MEHSTTDLIHIMKLLYLIILITGVLDHLILRLKIFSPKYLNKCCRALFQILIGIYLINKF